MELQRTRCVVDTSVVLKWFLPEEDAAKADILLDSFVRGALTFIAPDLLIYEFANVLRYKDFVGSPHFDAIFSILFELDMDFIFPHDYMQKAFELSRRFDLSVYDAVYLSVAEKFQCEFITADEKLYNKVKHELAWVKLLKFS